MADSGHSEKSLKCAVLRKYYLENDYFVSPEGILKGLSIICCILLAILFVWGGGCGAAVWGAAPALGAGAALAALAAARLLALAALAPLTCFFSPLSLINAALVISSAILTYMSVTSRWDAASGPAAALRPNSTEQEV